MNTTMEFCIFELFLVLNLKPKLIILRFWTKFAPKEHFRSKAEKVNITIEFCILELVYIPNFSLN